MSIPGRQISSPPSPTVPEFLALEAAGMCFLVVDETLQPLYISSKAASLFGIKHRQELDACSELFSELKPLVLSIPAKKTLLQHDAAKPSSPTRNIELRAADGRAISALASAAAFPITSSGSISQATKTYLITLRDISNLSPLFQSTNLYRALRPMMVLTASLYGEPIHKNEFAVISNTPPSPSSDTNVDLLEGITRVIDITDSLIPNTVKISVDTQASALISIGSSIFLRLLAHLLLEASEFTAFNGEVSLRSVVNSSTRKPKSSTKEGPSFAEVIITSKRHKTPSILVDDLDRYILQNCTPKDKMITIEDEEPTIKQLSSGEKTLRDADDTTELSNNASIPEESLSADAKLAIALGRQHQVNIQLRRPCRDCLVIYSEFPLL